MGWRTRVAGGASRGLSAITQHHHLTLMAPPLAASSSGVMTYIHACDRVFNARRREDVAAASS